MIRSKGYRATLAIALTLTTSAVLAACGGSGGSSASSSAPATTQSAGSSSAAPTATTTTPATTPTATTQVKPPTPTGSATTPAPSTPSRTVPSKPVTSSKVAAALSKFAACMRANKINVPNPNTSGKGPIFNLKGVNTASPQFRAALRKCASAFSGFLKVHPGIKVTPKTTPLAPPTTTVG